MQVNNVTIYLDGFDNDALVTDRTKEVIEILEDLIKKIKDYGIPHVDGSRLMDSSGNSVGYVCVDFE